MKKIIGTIIIAIAGWKIKSIPKSEIIGSVLVAAPHTTNWDLFYAMSYFWKFNLDVKFLIKDDYTKGWYGGFFKWMGAVGVNRSQSSNLVEFAVNAFHQNPEIIFLVPVEGTRKKGVKWKLGFYHIAKNANVPITLGFLDYKNKLMGAGKKVYPSKVSQEALFAEIESFYCNIQGKFPENYTPNILEKS